MTKPAAKAKMTHLEVAACNLFAQHLGAKSGIGADALARKLDVSPRKVRKIVSSLRMAHAIPICGTPGTGYYMATSPEELASGMAFLESRAMHSLTVINRMRAKLPEMLGQLRLSQA